MKWLKAKYIKWKARRKELQELRYYMRSTYIPNLIKNCKKDEDGTSRD